MQEPKIILRQGDDQIITLVTKSIISRKPILIAGKVFLTPSASTSDIRALAIAKNRH